MTQYFGTPTRRISDRGSAFTSKEFQKYIEDNAISHTANAVQTPRGNGQIERYFRTITPAITAMTKEADGSDWDKNIVAIQWGLNTLKHSSTGETPQELLMGYTPRSILKNKLILAMHQDDEKLPEEDEDNIPLSELRERVRIKLAEIQKEQAEKFNSNHRAPIKYQVDDLVLLKQQSMATGQPRKVNNRYRGPYQVKAVLDNDRYVVADTLNTQISQKPYEAVHAADRMKPWCKLSELNFDVGLYSDEENREDVEVEVINKVP